MRRLICAGIVMVAVSLHQDEKYINSLIDLLEEKNEHVRIHAHNELLDIGDKALPFLEKRIQSKGAGGCYKLIRDIESKRKPTRVILETELPDLELLKKQLKVVDKNHLSNYFLTKYAEAYEMMRRGELQAASEILDALLKLERFPPIQTEITHLRAFCDQKLIQSTVITAKISPLKNLTFNGDKLELEVQLENKLKDKLQIEFAANSQVLLQIQAHAFVLAGVEHTITRHETVEIDKNITIEKDKAWSKQVTIDTSTYDFSNHSGSVKYFYVWAYFSPSTVTGVNGPRIIPFAPAVIKMIPKENEELLKDPVRSLSQAIDKEKLADIFFLALAVGEDKRKDLYSSMVEWLAKTSSIKAQTAIARSLERVTGKKFDTVKEWQDWWKNARLQ